MVNFKELESLLQGDSTHWAALKSNLLERDCSSEQIKAVAKLAVSSRYALLQMAKTPQLAVDMLAETGSPESIGMPLIDGESVDLIELKKALRDYRHRKLTEIIYRDVVKQQPVWETLQQLSDLADQLISAAVDACYHNLCLSHGIPRHDSGEPMQLNVVAMGKLGGMELNFSSDVDLICCYANEGELQGYGNLSHQEFFSRLVRMMIDTLSDSTEQGFVYRTDLRLRPWGDSGPLVISHNALEHYYQLHGRQWERYALVKARLLTGNEDDRKALKNIIRPFVYRRYHDYQIFDGLATMKKQIELQANEKNRHDNIKLGVGGIREIEFLVQAFQLLRGGRNQRLQSPGIKNNLEILAEENIVDRTTANQLIEAYVFMRLLENRLQMYDDLQTHELPDDVTQKQRIAVGMNFDNWAAVLARLDQSRQLVQQHFAAIFNQHGLDDTKLQRWEEFSNNEGHAELRQFIEKTGVTETQAIYDGLQKFFDGRAWQLMPARARERFQDLLNNLLPFIARQSQQALVFDRLLKLFASIAGRSAYIELLAQNKPLLQSFAQVFHDSAWIADQVIRYPVLLETLLQSRTADQSDVRHLGVQLKKRIENVEDDYELVLDSLRVFKREHTLAIARDEVSGIINAREASILLCELAEVIIKAVLELASAEMRKQHGKYENSDCKMVDQHNVAIVAYGKFGGRELHYQSDLDLVFLHQTPIADLHGQAGQALQHSEYVTRLVQKVVSITNVITTSGRLYEIDTRLRPQGSSGLLVSSIKAYEDYQLNKAWSWEHQALVRARLISGSDALSKRFERLKAQILAQPRNRLELMSDITDMRARMRQQLLRSGDGFFNLKHSAGGLIDIEFMVQFWVLDEANSIGSLCSYSDNINLLNELFRLGLITDNQFKLAAIYQHYQGLLHKQVLQNLSFDVEITLVADEAAHVVQCWKACFAEVEK